jgi:CRP/FNR family transcriptional regulator, cyclic AMP receptor protein
MRDDTDRRGAENAVNDLGKCPIFLGLSPEELSEIAEELKFCSVRADDPIISRADVALDVYFLLEGRARVVHDTPLGRSVPLSELSTGSYFGELSAIDGGARSAGVQAVTDCRLARLSSDGFRHLLVTHPSVLVAVLQNLASIIRRTNATVLGHSIL